MNNIRLRGTFQRDQITYIIKIETQTPDNTVLGYRIAQRIMKRWTLHFELRYYDQFTQPSPGAKMQRSAPTHPIPSMYVISSHDMTNQLLCHLELSVFHVELGVVVLFLYAIGMCARFSSKKSPRET